MSDGVNVFALKNPTNDENDDDDKNVNFIFCTKTQKKKTQSFQSRFQSQEASLLCLTNENKGLQQRIRQYEHCLDDVMRKVVDAIVAEDNLREEVSMLKARVRDLEKQNAVLSQSSSSPSSSTGDSQSSQTVPLNCGSKGRGDEGYCTMSSGSGVPIAQHLPIDCHLENLAEEELEQQHQEQPLERKLIDDNAFDEATSANMEDWSLSHEELGAAFLYDENGMEHAWIWNSDNFLNSTVDSQSDSISQLLQDTVRHSFRSHLSDHFGSDGARRAAYGAQWLD